MSREIQDLLHLLSVTEVEYDRHLQALDIILETLENLNTREIQLKNAINDVLAHRPLSRWNTNFIQTPVLERTPRGLELERLEVRRLIQLSRQSRATRAEQVNSCERLLRTLGAKLGR